MEIPWFLEPTWERGGPDCIALLLADALDADGPLIAWLASETGIDVLTPLPEDRRRYAAAVGLARRGRVPWTRPRDVRTRPGKQQPRTVEGTSVGERTSWDSFVAVAQGSGVSDPSLGVARVRAVAPKTHPREPCGAGVSTRQFAHGSAALPAVRPRWQLEKAGARELKEGVGREPQRWGRDAAVAQGCTTLTILAFNTAQVDRSRGGARLAKLGLRRLRRQFQPELGRSPAVRLLDDGSAVRAIEELLAIVGLATRQGLLPALGAAGPPLGPL